MEIIPAFVYRDGIQSDTGYIEWLSDVKARFRQNQIKASIKVNTSMLEFYWSIGRDLVALQAEDRWGSGIVKQFALDMRRFFPEITGFSYSNVKYMKQWYSFYFDRIPSVNGQHVAGAVEKEMGQQVAGLLEMPPIFGQVPWFHHVHIISKCHSLDEALFYIKKVVEEGWSRSFLESQIAADLFKNKGNALSYFERTLPSPQNLLAKEMLKDPYHFDFLSMTPEYDERELEEALVTNITKFLLELGKGFSFVGRQMELQMPGGQTFFPDLIFYHIPQHRYVIIELKAVKYIPEFAGKLNFYVTAADELLRGEYDNPSVGLIICKSTDKTIVEWSLKEINKPLGVATYQLQEVVDRTIAEIEQKSKETI